MRRTLAGFLLVNMLGSGAVSAGEAIPLRCEVSGRTAGQLCDALRRKLTQRPAPEGVELVLHADTPRPDLLKARLDVIRDGARETGETGELSVIDRATLPESDLGRFANALIDRSNLFP